MMLLCNYSRVIPCESTESSHVLRDNATERRLDPAVKPRDDGARAVTLLFPIPAQSAEDLQQTQEEIENIQIQRHSGHNIIGFATVNDTASIIQNET